MTKDSVEDFFHIVSQAIPFIIVIFVIMAFSMRYEVFKTPTSTPTSVYPSLKPTTISVQKTIFQDSISFNPVKSFSCLYTSKVASVSAFRKDNSFFVQNQGVNETTLYLVQGDCLYSWKQGVFVGQKTCGIGQYINIANTLLSSGVTDISTLTNYLPKELAIGEVVKTCKNSEIKDQKIFDVPKNIIFKEIKK